MIRHPDEPSQPLSVRGFPSAWLERTASRRRFQLPHLGAILRDSALLTEDAHKRCRSLIRWPYFVLRYIAGILLSMLKFAKICTQRVHRHRSAAPLLGDQQDRSPGRRIASWLQRHSKLQKRTQMLQHLRPRKLRPSEIPSMEFTNRHTSSKRRSNKGRSRRVERDRLYCFFVRIARKMELSIVAPSAAGCLPPAGSVDRSP